MRRPCPCIIWTWYGTGRTKRPSAGMNLPSGSGKSFYKWIIDGNYGRTLETRLQSCDTVFLLDLPVAECLAAAESRIGRPREDMPWVETEFDEEFRQWILDFPRKELPAVYELLDRYRNEKEIYRFRSRDDIGNYLEKTFGR